MRIVKDIRKMAFLLAALVLMGTIGSVHATTGNFNFRIIPGGSAPSSDKLRKDDGEQYAYITTTSISGGRGETYGAVYSGGEGQVTWDCPFAVGVTGKPPYYKTGYAGHRYYLLGQDSEYHLKSYSIVKGRWTP